MQEIGKVSHIHIPKVMLEEFQRDARIVIKTSPAGLWPIGPEILKNAEFIKRLAEDKEFTKNFEIVVIAR